MTMLKMEILIWKLLQRALLLVIGSAILGFGISCRGARILAYDSAINPTPSMGEKSNWGYEFKFPKSLFAKSIGHQVTFMATATGRNSSIENDGRIQIYLFDNYTPVTMEKGTFIPFVANQLAFTFNKTPAGTIDIGVTTALAHTLTLTELNSVNLSLFVHTGHLHNDREDRPFFYTYTVIDWDSDGTDLDDLQKQMNQNLDDLKSELNGKITSETKKLQDQITTLQKALNDAIGKHDKDQAELLKKIEDSKKELSALITDLQQKLSKLEVQQAEYLAQLESLKLKHNQDVAALNARIDELAAQYAKDVADINGRIDEIADALEGLEQSFGADGSQLKKQIDELSKTQTALQHQLDLMERQHTSDISAVQQKIDVETSRLQAAHDSDIKLIQQSIGNLDSRFSAESQRLESSIVQTNNRLTQLEKEYAAGDKSLKEQIDDLKYKHQDLSNQLSNLTQTHSRDITELQKQISEKSSALSGKIDAAVADFRQEIVSLDNIYREKTADLKSDLNAVKADLASEVNKLNATDRDLYDRIADLREKQADYYSRLEILKVTHEKDMEAYRKDLDEINKSFDSTVADLNAEIKRLDQEAEVLREQHKQDVKAIEDQISAIVGNLDEEIRALYEKLTEQQEALEAHKAEVLKKIDALQLQITALDDAMTARLKSLENRIKYAVYSDEKLEALKKEYEHLVQAKETEIANIDLEIEELRKQGADTGAKEEIRNLKLKELTDLRNELSDIEFAIQLRHDDSEFAAHEAEIEWLKKELAALRNSTDLQIKQLEEKLAETEKRLLELLEQVKNEAGQNDAELKGQIADLQNKIDELASALRNEQLAGDEALKKQLEEMDTVHKELIDKLEKSVAEKLDRLKYEFDTQFENLRSSINNVAYQQRYSNGNSNSSYSLPGIQSEDVPGDNRDMRVSPDLMLEI